MSITQEPKRIIREEPDPRTTGDTILVCSDGSRWQKADRYRSTGEWRGYRIGNQIVPKD